MPTYPELKGKVAVVTGATGNLGSAVVRRLYAENVKFALVDRHPDDARELVKGIAEENLLLGAVDLTKKAEVDQFIEKVAATFGQIDILVHTAGGYKPGAPVHEMDEALWDSIMNLNAKTAFFISSAVARAMVAKGNKGRIINVSGRAGLTAFPTGSAYASAKASLLRITESMSGELLDRGITVNAILPSTIDTPQNRSNDPNADFSKWVSADSIADVIAFLVSDGARDISGAAIPVYGRS